MVEQRDYHSHCTLVKVAELFFMNYQRFKVKCEYYAYEYTSRVISNLANIVNLYTQIKFQLLDVFPATWSSALKQVAGLESRSVLQNAALPLLETVPRLCNGLPKTPVCHNMYCDNRFIFFLLNWSCFLVQCKQLPTST